MKTMETPKQKAIREAWGEFWQQFPNRQKQKIVEDLGVAYTDETMFDGNTIYPKASDERFTSVDFSCSTYGYRGITPKSLAGIENNNGWLSVKEHGLPKEDGKYFAYSVEQKILMLAFNESELDMWIHRISHYQPVLKPKPPIY